MVNGKTTSSGDDDVQAPLECDAGLRLNSESSYPCKKMSFMSNSYPYHHYHQQASEVYGINNGGFENPNNTNYQIASGISFKSATDGVMGASGKVLFTANQWQELERQTMIYKYIMASIPVPPQLLLPLSIQSNRVSTGLRFSNGSDPEPWRCRRTDGKKWRCAKDVAPDQKYCERHAHKTKTKSRSRKPVETQSHNIEDKPIVLSVAPSSNQQTSRSEWFTKNNANPVSQSTTQFHQSASDTAAGARRQDFIDAWSRIGGQDCSLTLSMQSGVTETEFDHETFQMAVGMLSDQRVGGECGDGSKPHHEWLNQGGSWTTGSTPGGPLGEALCLGMTTSEPSTHGYSNGSCEDGGDDHGIGFH